MPGVSTCQILFEAARGCGLAGRRYTNRPQDRLAVRELTPVWGLEADRSRSERKTAYARHRARHCSRNGRDHGVTENDRSQYSGVKSKVDAPCWRQREDIPCASQIDGARQRRPLIPRKMSAWSVNGKPGPTAPGAVSKSPKARRQNTVGCW
jgi:hypothetical protein